MKRKGSVVRTFLYEISMMSTTITVPASFFLWLVCCCSWRAVWVVDGFCFLFQHHLHTSSTIIRLTPRPPTDATTTLLHAAQQQQGGDDEKSSSNNNNNNNDDDGTFLEALKARQFELNKEKFVLEQKWRNADCSSGICAALPNDWIRRLDVDYPLAACGSSKGSVYVTHLETGRIIAAAATTIDATKVQEEEENKPEGLDTILRLMFGSYDGGGTLAIAFKDGLICVANREGSVQVYRLLDVESSSAASPSSGQQQQQQQQQLLVSQGVMGALKGTVVTYLHLDDDYLWVGTGNGKLQAYALDSDLPLVLQGEPEMEWSFSTTPVMSIDFCPELGIGVVATSRGSVELISIDDDDKDDNKDGKKSIIASLYPPFNSNVRRSSNAYPLCATIVQHQCPDEQAKNSSNNSNNIDDKDSSSNAKEEDDDDDNDDRMCYSIACGGNDGSIWLQKINTEGAVGGGGVNKDKPFSDSLEELRPNHLGRVKCLVSPLPGLLVSGGLDGTMRIWDVKDRETLYQFVGYKVWLGSLWTDGKRLVSDGRDNAVVVHDFSKDYDELQEY